MLPNMIFIVTLLHYSQNCLDFKEYLYICTAIHTLHSQLYVKRFVFSYYFFSLEWQYLCHREVNEPQLPH